MLDALRITMEVMYAGCSTIVTVAVLLVAYSGPAWCQTLPPPARVADLSGPRFGGTFLSDGVVQKLKADDGIRVAPMITQFGWQFEKQFYNGGSGVAALTEAVVLFGGMEQGLVLPSLSWLVGLRTRGGAEFAIGPNVTPVGVALALAAGTTFRAGILNVPVNVAVVPSKSRAVSMLTGFSLRRPRRPPQGRKGVPRISWVEERDAQRAARGLFEDARRDRSAGSSGRSSPTSCTR